MVKQKFIKRLAGKSFILSGIISFFMFLFGIAGAMLAATGVCIFCVAPALAGILGLFGLSVGTLLDYNIYFLSGGFAFVLLSIYLYRKKKCEGKVCKL